jgi:hypothetical protein
MPNWTTNVLSVTGHKSTIRKFMAAVKSKERSFDFDRVLPIPKVLKNISTGGRTIEGVQCDAWYEMGEDGAPVAITGALKAKIKAKANGFHSWYEWCCAMWGTKWNARHPEKPELQKHVNGRTHTAVYRFDTAWCPPIPVLMAASKKFPGLHLSLYEESEGSDQWNEYSLKAGLIGSHDIGTTEPEVNEDEEER